jgi:hypothetical protein
MLNNVNRKDDNDELGAWLVLVKVKVKIHPGTGHEDPEGENRYSSTLFNLGIRWGGYWGHGGKLLV